MEEIKEMFNEEIKACLRVLGNTSPDDDKYENTLNSLMSLCKLKNDEMKLIVEKEEREARREIDIQHHEAELLSNEKMKQEQIDADAIKHREEMDLQRQQIKISKGQFWLNVFGLGLPLGVYTLLYILGLNFEKYGTITSGHFRTLLNNVLFKHKK